MKSKLHHLLFIILIKNISHKLLLIMKIQKIFFHSNGSSNQWICFDFNEHKVIPTDYTIRSQPYGPGNAHPKNWVIEGSNDNVAYEIISEEKNNSCLNKKSVVHTFTMNRQQDKEYRFIRMRLTGPNWNSNHYFYITSFEIYGKLI